MKRICGFIMVLIMLLTGPASAIAKVSRNEAKLLCLNIGKADCMLLLYGNTNWLIDTGYEVTYNALKTALDEYQIDHLDGVFLTHCHEDHDGGLMPLAQSNIPVNAWYASSVWFDVEEGEHPAVLAAKERGEEVTWLSAGDIIPVDADTSFTVLGPLDINEENENNNSLVLLFSSPAGSILLCGDMKKDEEKDLLNAGNIPSCSLLKVGHHGDNGTFSKHFLTAVRPETAVISTSTAQEPDTPAPSTLHKLKEIGCAAYVTQDFHDAVLFTLSNGNVTSVEDIIWENAPPRIIGITLDIRGLGLILLFQTGMRVGELAVLKRENIQNDSIRVTATEETFYDSETGKRVSEPVDHAKTDAGERTILLPETAEKTLKAIRALNPFGEFLFMDKQGRRIRANRFNHWLHRACKKVGIPERSTHKIRKTYASILLSNRVDDRLVTSQMGHTDISTTRGSYYFNRNSEDQNKKLISSVINF